MTVFVLLVMISAVVAVCFTQTRAARFKRFAHQFHLLYHPQQDCILTPDEEQYSFFLGQGTHCFWHILTWRDVDAFVRISEDRVFADTGEKTPQWVYTLLTAELTRGTFPPLILMPRHGNETTPVHPALPPQLADRYVLFAAPDFRFPQAVLGFLKAAGPCYLELTSRALVYHEFKAQPLSQVQSLHLRGRQLISALKQKTPPEHGPAPAQVVPAPACGACAKNEAELQARVLLKLQHAPHAYNPSAGSSGAGRWFLGFVFLIAVAVLLFLVRYMFMHFAHT